MTARGKRGPRDFDDVMAQADRDRQLPIAPDRRGRLNADRTITPVCLASDLAWLGDPPRKSRGHIRWTRDGRGEYLEHRGEVYLAPYSAAFELDTGNRIGRWECSRAHFDRFEAIGGVFA